jgi:hypothetical protein
VAYRFYPRWLKVERNLRGGNAEVPLKVEAFALSIVNYSVMIASKLRIVTRHQQQSSQCSLAKLFYNAAITKVALHVPVRGDRAEVLHANVRKGLLIHLQVFRFGGNIAGNVGGFAKLISFGRLFRALSKTLFELALSATKIASHLRELTASEND